MNALLALAASVLWGSSDFGGGLMSRRLHPSAAVLISQAIVLACLLALLPFLAVPGGWYLLTAAVAGVIATLSLASFYRAMADAPLSLVAPITAAGTCIPVLVGLARGEQLTAFQAAGIAVTLIGVILACGPEFRAGVHVRRQAVIFAVLAAAGFGVAYTLLALAAGDGSLYGTLLLQRVGGLVVLAPVVLRGRILGQVRLTGRAPAARAVDGRRRCPGRRDHAEHLSQARRRDGRPSRRAVLTELATTPKSRGQLSSTPQPQVDHEITFPWQRVNAR